MAQKKRAVKRKPKKETATIAPKSGLPEIRAAEVSDLGAVLKLGWRDFYAAPKYGLFFGLVYALGGIVLVSAVIWFKLSWLIYPLVIGFALIGPFVATGLYEVSRRRELGLEMSWSAILGVIWAQHRRELGWMAFVMLFVFWVWMYQIRTLVAVFFGFGGFATLEGFISAVLTTRQWPHLPCRRPPGRGDYIHGAVFADRSFVPAAAGSGSGFRDRNDHLDPGGCSVSACHARLGGVCRTGADDIGFAGLRRIAGNAAGIRSRDLASLPPRGPARVISSICRATVDSLSQSVIR